METAELFETDDGVSRASPLSFRRPTRVGASLGYDGKFSLLPRWGRVRAGMTFDRLRLQISPSPSSLSGAHHKVNFVLKWALHSVIDQRATVLSNDPPCADGHGHPSTQVCHLWGQIFACRRQCASFRAFQQTTEEMKLADVADSYRSTHFLRPDPCQSGIGVGKHRYR